MAASQPWVALLDSDDEWLPHHLETLWRSRENHVLVASSALRCADDPARDRFHGAARGRPLVLSSPADVIYPENPVPVSAGMYQRELALEVGGYDERLPHCADLDFLLRCLEHGSGLVRPEVGAIYHVHDAQVSSQREEMKAAHTRIACSYADRPWFSRAQVERWRAAVAWDLYRLSGGRAPRGRRSRGPRARPRWCACGYGACRCGGEARPWHATGDRRWRSCPGRTAIHRPASRASPTCASARARPRSPRSPGGRRASRWWARARQAIAVRALGVRPIERERT